MCSDSEEVQKSVSPTPEVDDEGYSKPPPNASRIGIDDDPWADFNRHQSNFGSSSDDSGKSSFSKGERLLPPIFKYWLYFNHLRKVCFIE